MANLSNYVKGTVSVSTAVPIGSTGVAVAYSTAYGFPTDTTGFDMQDFEGIYALAAFAGTTAGALQPYMAKGATGGVSLQSSSTWAVIMTTGVGYSTTFFSLGYDLYRPASRFVSFVASITSTSGSINAITVIQYGAKKEATALGQFTSNSTIFVGPST